MNKKQWQRLIDGMPPHIAKKVDKMISEMKQLHDAATDYGWKVKTNTFSDPVKANELAESAKQDFIAGAKWMMEKQKQKQALVDIMEEDAKNGMYDQHKEQWKGWISMKRIEEMKKRDEDKIKVTVKKDSPAADIIKAAKEEKQAFKETVESGNSKQQTVVTWLINELIQNRLMALRYDADNTFGEIIEKAKQMEKEQSKQEYEYIGECKGNDGNGCFMDSPGHNCGCFVRIPKQEPTIEQIDQNNPVTRGSTALVYRDGTPMRKYNSLKLKAIEMENKQQTAVDWLIEQMVINNYISPGQYDNADWLIEEAKQMEKEQIIKIANDTDDSDFWVKYESFEQYYNETFNQQ